MKAFTDLDAANAMIEILENENAELREQVRQLETDAYGGEWVPPLQFGLTVSEAAIVGVLAHRELATREQLFYATRSIARNEDAHIKIVDVWVSRARPKLRKFGIEIETYWGRGWSITDAAKRARLRDGWFTGGAHDLDA